MDDCLWMYQDSPEKLRKMDYCNEVEGFINYALSNGEILVEVVLDIHVKGVKIKKFINLDV
jgi:hypothetical protein